jgi:hypothetical protein
MIKSAHGTRTGTWIIWLLAGLPAGLWGQEGERLEIGFEDLPVSVPPLEAYSGPGGGAYYNGSDGAGGFTSDGVFFGNDYNADWMSWSGWAYSTTTDAETGGWDNQYSAYAGGAASGEVYAVTYAPSVLELPVGYRGPVSIKVTNTSYAAVSMRDGDPFAKKFGDDPATPEVVETDYPDWFKLTITGRAESGTQLGSVEVMLADFRGEAETDFILEDWLEVDLRPLRHPSWPTDWNPGVARIEFSLESSDVGDFGMNTPAYIAVDDLVLEETAAWGPYDLTAGPEVDTGSWLGWVYVEDPWVYAYSLGRWIYLPGESIDADSGAWAYIPDPAQQGS